MNPSFKSDSSYTPEMTEVSFPNLQTRALLVLKTFWLGLSCLHCSVDVMLIVPLCVFRPQKCCLRLKLMSCFQPQEQHIQSSLPLSSSSSCSLYHILFFLSHHTCCYSASQSKVFCWMLKGTCMCSGTETPWPVWKADVKPPLLACQVTVSLLPC